jgi:hypothetical protein
LRGCSSCRRRDDSSLGVHLEVAGIVLGSRTLAHGNDSDGGIVGKGAAVGDGELDLALGAEAFVGENGLDIPPHATLRAIEIHAVEGCGETLIGGDVPVCGLPGEQ